MLADASAGAIFRCEVQGKVVYSDQPCGPGGRAVDVLPSQGYEAPQRKPQAAPTAPVEPAPAPAPVAAPAGQASTPDPEAQRKQRCELIEQDIQDNEAAARQPQIGSRQDALTAARRKLVAQKDALGC